jgi:ATP-binding cassette subfamily B protein
LHPATIYINELYADGRHPRDLEDFLVRARGLITDSQTEPVAPPAFRSLRLDDVTLTYADRDRPAVDHVSLTITAGQTVAFVGENGSGKSTLAAIRTGLRPRCDRHRHPRSLAVAVHCGDQHPPR